MAEEEHHRTHGRVITLNDVANRLVALADSASTYADVYAIILEDETLHSEVQAEFVLNRLAVLGSYHIPRPAINTTDIAFPAHSA